MNNKGEIYIATNKVNGKQYVGKTTKGFKKRLINHLFFAKRPKQYFHKALKKYGKENFEFEVIEYATEELNKHEIALIKELNCKAPNGYNCTDGGDGANNLTQEALKKMSKTWFKKGISSGTPIQKEQHLSIDTEFKKGIRSSITTEFSKGSIPWNKGLDRCLNTGKTHFKKGFTPWNKGLKGLQVAWNKGTEGICKLNSGSFKKGQIPWIKGKTKKDIENYKLLRIAN